MFQDMWKYFYSPSPSRIIFFLSNQQQKSNSSLKQASYNRPITAGASSPGMDLLGHEPSAIKKSQAQSDRQKYMLAQKRALPTENQAAI